MVQAAASVNDYQSAKNFLNGRDEKRIAHNTKVVSYCDGSIGIVYHATAIVKYYPNGEVRLDCGGWQTTTTTQRLNQFGPIGWHFYRKDFVLYASDGKESYEMDKVITISPSLIG